MTQPKSSLCRRRAFQWPVATCVGALFALALFVLPALSGWGQWQRWTHFDEHWRVLTCHFVHFSTLHFAYDWLVFVGVGAVCETRWPRRTFYGLLGALLLIPWMVWFFEPGIAIYRGLSGLGSALVILLATRSQREGWFQSRRSRWIPWAVVLGFFLKLAFEWSTQTSFFVGDPFTFIPVTLAHGVGGLVGLIAGLVGGFPAKTATKNVSGQQGDDQNGSACVSASGCFPKA